MSLFTSIDLSELPPPSLVEELDYEALLAATKNELQKIAPELTIDSLLESDPISKVLEVMAYREMHLRQRINESAQGVMLATATGANLDNLAALVNIQRLMIDPGDPDAAVDPVYEDDIRLRARTQLAFEGFSTAGPTGAYIFHALSASARVKDVAVYSEFPGEVEVRILSGEGSGLAPDELLTTVATVLNADEIRPITDLVKVKSADIIPYNINATLVLSPGVGAQEVLESARVATQAFIKKHHNLGIDITRAALFSALYQPGVQNVELREPSSDILVERHEAPFGTIGTIKSVDHPTTEPVNLANGIKFDNRSTNIAKVAGIIEIEPAVDELDITHYAIYWGGNNAQKLPLAAKIHTFDGGQLSLDHGNAINLVITSLDGRNIYLQEQDYVLDNRTVTALNASIEDSSVRVTYELPAIVEIAKGSSSLQHSFATGTDIPEGATHLIVFSLNEFGEMSYGVSTEIRFE